VSRRGAPRCCPITAQPPANPTHRTAPHHEQRHTPQRTTHHHTTPPPCLAASPSCETSRIR
jgi:hypothetical protein